MARLRTVQRACLHILAWGALLAGCSDPVGLSAGAVDDLFSEITATWSSSTNPVSVRPGLTYLATPPAASTCPYNGSTNRFVCPNRTVSGLAFSTSFQLLDGGQAPQTSFDARTSDAIRTFTDVVGKALQVDATTVTTLTARDERVLSGLLSGTHTLNGTGTSTFTTTIGSTTTTTTMLEATADLILAPRGGPLPYPKSGSITTEVYSGIPGAGATLLATVTSQFNGTQTVTLLIDTSGVMQTCTIDLKGVTPTICT